MSKERISSFIRRRVLERDGLRCVYCDLDLTNLEVHLDHVIPESQGVGGGISQGPCAGSVP